MDSFFKVYLPGNQIGLDFLIFASPAFVGLDMLNTFSVKLLLLSYPSV